ncbi:transmembrane and tpr repeat-containing protein hypothetical protein [Limosa lapponica baueri]|uniref:dolichyl-phosphate-mannose--protein mannosyltransferase n=1 Tax=Limosa lapponica baueri TaxID=1758121 RepID=A0A2I0TZI1_LIMLA|nr:transmembrane and tpr repeat-containing protein hypothetical protein [Limosa lapponica baueri]
MDMLFLWKVKLEMGLSLAFKFLTYSYLLAFNAWLLLAPITLCYDWQVGSIPLIESVWDVRNLATVFLVLVMALLSLHCIAAFKKLEHKEVLVGLLFLVFPFIPASNLFFRVGFVVAERVLYMPSMGYCILFVHGLKKLSTWLNKWRITVLTLFAFLLLLFSWKTIKQNEIWLSRESLFSSGVKTLPHNAKVHYNYANFLKDQGRNVEAIYHYKTALKSQGKKEEAVILLRDSIKYGPEFADAYSSLASLLAEQAFNTFSCSATADDDLVVQLLPLTPILVTVVGAVLQIHAASRGYELQNHTLMLCTSWKGAPERAVSHYRQAIRLSPAHHVAMVNLGRLHRSLGQNKEAEVWYKRALKVSRKPEILSPLGALYYNTGRYEEALQVYREAASLQPSNKEIRLALAQVLAMMGRTKEAEKMTNHILNEDAECLECYRLLSAIYSKQEHYAKALEAIEKALQLKPKDPKVISELFFTKGNQLREQNLLDKAFESYKRAVELNPDQAQAWMNMGGIEHIKGSYITARGYYEKALQLVPNSKLLKENLAKLDRLEKRFQEVQEKDQT